VVQHDCGTCDQSADSGRARFTAASRRGLGTQFYEKLVFDDQGQLLNASLADYLLPTALEVPRMELGPYRDEVTA